MQLQRIGHNWATFISSYWARCPPLGLELLYLCSTQEHWLLLGDRQEDPYKGIQWGWWHWDDRLSWACVNQPNIWWTFTLPHEASFFSGFTHPLLCSYASMMVFFHISIISFIHLHYFFFFWSWLEYCCLSHPDLPISLLFCSWVSYVRKHFMVAHLSGKYRSVDLSPHPETWQFKDESQRAGRIEFKSTLLHLLVLHSGM